MQGEPSPPPPSFSSSFAQRQQACIHSQPQRDTAEHPQQDATASVRGEIRLVIHMRFWNNRCCKAPLHRCTHHARMSDDVIVSKQVASFNKNHQIWGNQHNGLGGVLLSRSARIGGRGVRACCLLGCTTTPAQPVFRHPTTPTTTHLCMGKKHCTIAITGSCTPPH